MSAVPLLRSFTLKYWANPFIIINTAKSLHWKFPNPSIFQMSSILQNCKIAQTLTWERNGTNGLWCPFNLTCVKIVWELHGVYNRIWSMIPLSFHMNWSLLRRRNLPMPIKKTVNFPHSALALSRVMEGVQMRWTLILETERLKTLVL